MKQRSKPQKRARYRAKKAGLPPGTLVYVGERKLETVRITILDYDENTVQERQVDCVEDCFQFKTTPTSTWINIDGLHEVKFIEEIGKHYDLHPLTLEDILHTGQRPKFENLESYLFVVLMMLRYDDESQTVLFEQVSLILGSHYVISFQENVGDVFDQVRERIRNGKGKIRKMGPDYLMYSLLDAVVDNYFGILEKLGEKIEILEEELVDDPTERTLHHIYNLKREMVFLRKSVWPLRELISGLERSESALIEETTDVYLRDVYDHTIQVIETVESFRDMISGMLDIYLSSISNRMNAVMKVLTIIATIFIPLTFIAGIYGMNFNPEVSPWSMPELNWRYGYAAVWLVMLVVAGLMVLYFKRKKWF
ncbi:MAG: magnesium/cobalt transporter CorA [Sedimentisphaerales bacterium]|nr:magnesium/cobalt transporter CorA [Sedimentisphaerales bacterium]